jgi:D-aminopeptidase
MESAARYWLYLSAMRAGDKEAAAVLTPVRADWDIIENTSYHQLLLHYRGDQRLAADESAAQDPLQNATLGYGLAMTAHFRGDTESWRSSLRQLTSGPEWAAFGSIAAEADLARSLPRARDRGIVVGVLPPGPNNAITDVDGVSVGQFTLIEGEAIRTGVTAVRAHDGNLFQSKVPAAVHVFNAFGKSAGLLQVRELGELETPVVLTNTLSVGTALSATVRWTLEQPGNEDLGSVNAVIGETNDGHLNDIRGQHVDAEHVNWAIASAASGRVTEGTVGAGTGTRAFGYKGGIGTASRIAPVPGDPTATTPGTNHYRVGVLVQANFGWMLKVLGAPVGRELMQPEQIALAMAEGDGSCMIVIATDAPLDSRNLERMARRAFSGMARTRSVMTNGSGDFAIAFSTAYRIPHGADRAEVPALVSNNAVNPLFHAVEEATEEAIYNALFAATSVTGREGHRVDSLPRERVLEILRRSGLLHLDEYLPESPYSDR